MTFRLSTPSMDYEEPLSPRSTIENRNVSIPRGGPVFVSDLVSGTTRAHDFESSVLREIEILKNELSSSSTTAAIVGDDDKDNAEDEDISVDELRLLTDEELLSAAMNEMLKELCDRPLHEASEGGETNGMKTNGATPLKRKRQSKSKGKQIIVHDKNNDNDEGYLLIAEMFARVKQKQIEDKATTSLHCLTSLVSERQQQNKFEALILEDSGRAQSLLSLGNPAKVKPSQAVEQLPIKYPETVLVVEVYHWKRTTQKVQEIMVLGCQLLTELRDKIYCLIDGVMQKAGQHDPSGYFLVEDIFYNDLRDPTAIDYSRPILDWLKNSPEKALAKWQCIISGVAKQSKMANSSDSNSSKVDSLDSNTSDLPSTLARLPHFKAVEMHKVRFGDVKFRVGAGYLYCHQGDCKHTIVIRDMRLIHPEDVQNRAAYPLVSYQQKFMMTKCSVCKLYKATKVTLDDKWAGENPCYFCDNCYFLLHYDEDGSLLYDRFSVYEYLQDY